MPARRSSPPARARAHSRAISAGISLEATEMTPSPPSASSGKVQESSPESTAEAGGPVAQDGHDLFQVRGGLLDRHDAGMLREPQQRRGIDVAARPAGHVVDDDRQAALVRDGPVVRLEHPLVGLVVVRRDHEGRVGPQGRGPAGRRDGRGGVVGAGTGDDRDAAGQAAAGDRLDGQADEPVVLLVGRRGRLAGRAARARGRRCPGRAGARRGG